MSEQLQLRRGTAAQIASAAAPAQGEAWVDTTNNRFIVGDGTTVGGWPAAKLVEVITNNRTGVGDANYTVLSTDRLVAYTGLTAARVVTLPASAGGYPVGTELTIADETGNCSATNTITINRAGTDTINGQPSIAIGAPYGFVALENNGAGKWTLVGQAAGGATGVLGVAAGGSGVAPKSVIYTLAALAVNANAVADNAIAVALPYGLSRYRVQRISCLNPSTPLSVAQAGVYTSVSGGGTAIAAAQTLAGLTTNAPNSAGNAIDLTLALAAATFFGAPTLYFRITTAQGSAATVDVVIEIQPYD